MCSIELQCHKVRILVVVVLLSCIDFLTCPLCPPSQSGHFLVGPWITKRLQNKFSCHVVHVMSFCAGLFHSVVTTKLILVVDFAATMTHSGMFTIPAAVHRGMTC